MNDALLGKEAMAQLFGEYRTVPLALALYGILVTSLTAGASGELVWRGYIQTRLEYKLGKVWLIVLIQAVIFGFWHWLSLHTVFTAVFGFIYTKTRKLCL